MRILNQDNDTKIKDLLILLTYQEACELKGDLEQLIAKKQENIHTHINDMDYQHEITLSIYDENNLDCFQERVKKLILNDE